MTKYPKDAEITTNSNISKPRVLFYERANHCLLSYYHPVAGDGELFYYCKLLEKYPHRAHESEKSLLSKGNEKQSYLVEYVLRSTWDDVDELEFEESMGKLWKNNKITKVFIY